jgi:signal transduction histidine kinase
MAKNSTLVKFLLTFYNFFLYRGGYNTGDPLKDSENLRSARMAIGFSLVMFFLIFLMFFVRFYLEGMEQSKTLFLLPIVATLSLVLPLLIKYFNKISLLIHIEALLGLSVIVVRTLSTGGIGSPVILWFCLIPLLGTIIGIRASIAWTFITINMCFVILFADKVGLPVNDMHPKPSVNALVIVIILIVLCLMSILYEKKRIENEIVIRESERDLANSKKLAALGQLSGGIAHEINNPLTILSGRIRIVSTLHKRKQLDEERLEKEINSIVKLVSRVESIVNTLRTFSKDDYMTDFKIIDFGSVVSEAVIVFKDLFDTKNIALFNKLEGQPYFVLGNSNLLERAVFNLIKNSYGEIKDSDHPWIEIDVEDKLDPDFLVVNLTDSGYGIPDQIADRLMEPFFTTKKVGEGTGLGLSLTQNILSMHKGKLKYNAENQNTQFQLYFPKINPQSEMHG